MVELWLLHGVGLRSVLREPKGIALLLQTELPAQSRPFSVFGLKLGQRPDWLGVVFHNHWRAP